MKLGEINNWFKTRIANKYGVTTNEVDVLISTPDEVKWIASELVDTTVKYIHGKVPIAHWDTTGAFYCYSYGIVRERDTDNYYPDAQQQNTKPLMDAPSTPEQTFKDDAETYLETNNIYAFSNTWSQVNTTRGTVSALEQGRNLATLGFGTSTVENCYHVWKDESDVFHHEKVKNIKITTSPTSI